MAMGNISDKYDDQEATDTRTNGHNKAVFVWRDKNVTNSFNGSIFLNDNDNNSNNDIYPVSTTSDAINKIKSLKNNNYKVFVITNGGDNAEEFVKIIRNELNIKTQTVVFTSTVDWHKKWAAKYYNVTVLNGKENLKNWVNGKRNIINKINQYEEKNDDNNTKSYKLQYSDNKVNKYGLKTVLFKVSNKSDLELNNKIKVKGIRDESGFNVIPITPKPVLSFKLNISYNNWTESMKQQFLQDLAKELEVNVNDLSILCSSRGSINVSVMINAVQKQFEDVPITCSYIENKQKTFKYSNNMKKYCIESTKIESWFDESQKDKDFKKLNDNNNSIQSLGSLTPTEKWLLDQTKSIGSSLESVLSKINTVKLCVEAICILDNDEALKQFIKHPNMGNSKLLFHGTYKSVLSSIFKDGLKHGGGSVYGHGSYLTSSPLHSIRYMLCYKGFNSSTTKFTLIAAYVNCGKINKIYDKSHNQKNILYPYDTHYIGRVCSTTDTKYLGFPAKDYDEYKGEIADEYAIKDKTRILPRFYITLKKQDTDNTKSNEYKILLQKLVNQEYIVQKHKSLLNANKDYTVQVQVSHCRQVENNNGLSNMTCLQCNHLCHKNCPKSDDQGKAGCNAIDNNGYCTVCPGRCHWCQHRCLPYTIETYNVTETRTLQSLKHKYENAQNELTRSEMILKDLQNQISKLEKQIQ